MLLAILAAVWTATLVTSCDKSTAPNVQKPEEGAHIFRGRIQTTDHEPVSSATLFVIDPGDFSLLAETRTDSRGRFALSLRKTGPWWVGVQKPTVAAYVDTAFVFGLESVLTVEPARNNTRDVQDGDLPPEPQPTAKPLEDHHAILGDVTRNGVVEAEDVFALLGHILNPATSGLGGSAFLGDINGDDTIDWVDLGLLGDYVISGDNPYGIGREVEMELTAELTPSPSDAVFLTDGQWQTFAVSTNADSLLVKVNGPGTDVVLEIAGGNRAPRRNFCGPEAGDSPSRARRNRWNLHLAGCEEGSTEVVLMDYLSRDTLRTYSVTVQSDVSEEDQEGRETSSSMAKIYWTSGLSIYWADLDGSNIQHFRADWANPEELAVDSVNDKLYWYDNRQYTVVRANLDGSSPEEIPIRRVDSCCQDFRFDLPNGAAYRVIRGAFEGRVDTLYHVNLNTGEERVLLTSGNSISPLGAFSNRIFVLKSTYWKRPGAIVSISATGVTDILNGELAYRLVEALFRPLPVFDTQTEKMYWVEEVLRGLSSALFRSDYSGLNEEQVITVDHMIGALALDSTRNVLYWMSYKEPGIGQQERKYGLHRFALGQGINVENLIVRTESDGRFLSSSHMALYNP